MKRKDLLTNEEFIPLRITQKFASAANRIKYYNQIAKDFRVQTNYIKKPLLSNIKILNELMQGKLIASFHKEFLSGKGFDFTAYFQSIKVDDNTRIIQLHQYTLQLLNNNSIEIKKLLND